MVGFLRTNDRTGRTIERRDPQYPHPPSVKSVCWKQCWKRKKSKRRQQGSRPISSCHLSALTKNNPTTPPSEAKLGALTTWGLQRRCFAFWLTGPRRHDDERSPGALHPSWKPPLVAILFSCSPQSPCAFRKTGQKKENSGRRDGPPKYMGCSGSAVCATLRDRPGVIPFLFCVCEEERRNAPSFWVSRKG